MKPGKWTYIGDVNMLDYGGKNSRCIGKRQYQFVELINMDDACGRDNEGQPRYVVELRLVDLNAVGEKNIQAALRCCGQDEGQALADDIVAEFCDSYGTHAPLGSWSGNNARKLMRDAYREANALLDSEALETKLDSTVNRIGSTAREFMSGDLTSALQRGCESGNPDARLITKMYGVAQDVIDDTRPADWLPYVFGYMAAIAGGTKETDPDTAKEYFRGFERGENVKAGKCPAPSWIQQQPLAA